MNPYEWLNNFYSFYMAAVVSVVSKHGVGIDACHRNQYSKINLVLCKQSIHFNSCLCFSYNGESCVHGHHTHYQDV